MSSRRPFSDCATAASYGTARQRWARLAIDAYRLIHDDTCAGYRRQPHDIDFADWCYDDVGPLCRTCCTARWRP